MILTKNPDTNETSYILNCWGKALKRHVWALC